VLAPHSAPEMYLQHSTLIFFKLVWAIPGPFYDHINFIIHLSIFE
jgi:hypothetical protein